MTTELKKLTPVLPVAAIEPSLPFFARAGFEQTVGVPGPDGALGFVILAKDACEVMLQTHASIAADVPAFAEPSRSSTQFLFVEVGSIDAIEQAFAGEQPVLPRRTTFYGATEIVYREPGGHVICFAEMGREG